MGKSLSQILDEYQHYLTISTNIQMSTIEKYRGMVRLFLLHVSTKNAGKAYIEFNLSDVNDYIAEKNRSLSTYPIKYALRHFLIFAGRNDWAEALISAKKQPRKKVFMYLDPDKMEVLLNMIIDKTFKRMAFMQYKTGLRFVECVTLRAENIDWHKHPDLIYIRIGVGKSHTKGSKEGLIRLKRKYEPMLRKWISKPYGYIFLPEKCESMNEEEIRRYLKTMLVNYDRALKKPGEFFDIPNLSSHYLRHLFANHMRMNKVDIGVVKTMMRHKKFETTEGYITATAEDIADESLLGLEE